MVLGAGEVEHCLDSVQRRSLVLFQFYAAPRPTMPQDGGADLASPCGGQIRMTTPEFRQAAF